ncbi:MAG: hypothetical protein JOZ83_11905 [Silvibacterium sp.]|nr:hypothetical protein [Silvibacterium sp.]
MPILRELVLAVQVLIMCLLVGHAVFGPDPDAPIRPPAAVSSAWIGADALPVARWLAKDSFVTGGPSVVIDEPAGEPGRERTVTPQARIRGVFAQFVPGESGLPYARRPS